MLSNESGAVGNLIYTKNICTKLNFHTEKLLGDGPTALGTYSRDCSSRLTLSSLLTGI